MTVQDWRSIPYVNWQMASSLGRPKPASGTAPSVLGQYVVAADDVAQAVEAIIYTEQGTVPLEPTKCVRLLPWVDRPDREAIPNMTRELWNALTTYEPRIVVESVTVKALAYCRWLFTPKYYLRGDVTKKILTQEVPYGPT